MSAQETAMEVDGDGDGETLTLATLPLDVQVYLCSYLTRYELGKLMRVSTQLASVALAIGAFQPITHWPFCAQNGPLTGIYMSQYFDDGRRPCHRAWRRYHPNDPRRLLSVARTSVAVGQHAMCLPMSVPTGAWCMVRAPLEKLVVDLLACYMLFGSERLSGVGAIRAAALSERFPDDTLFCIDRGNNQHEYIPIRTYADAFGPMARYEAAHTSAYAPTTRWRPDYDEAAEAAERYCGPTSLSAARSGEAGAIVITMRMVGVQPAPPPSRTATAESVLDRLFGALGGFGP